MVFMHSSSYINYEIYTQLGIEHIVEQKKFSKNEEIIAELKKQEDRNVLYLHSPTTNQESLIETMVQFLESDSKMNK